VAKTTSGFILTTQSDNMHMVCCWKVHLYHLVTIAGLYRQKKGKNGYIYPYQREPVNSSHPKIVWRLDRRV